MSFPGELYRSAGNASRQRVIEFLVDHREFYPFAVAFFDEFNDWENILGCYIVVIRDFFLLKSF